MMCLKRKPEHRPTLDEISQHPWLTIKVRRDALFEEPDQTLVDNYPYSK
ncbi:hypothetical protein DNTS_022350 [Danionella cerebrum]|uniref:Protein kinase domain-containing protein n=1 Tax=Danionella cerebrum TaxID=2873325 RepID=A0A553RCU3_9TELE|nr:hypothetical protein DNTS_022350 [Danionella translucida]TRZ00009.1 hypothetical protein DNTS_022350 [Danionella translucida]